MSHVRLSTPPVSLDGLVWDFVHFIGLLFVAASIISAVLLIMEKLPLA